MAADLPTASGIRDKCVLRRSRRITSASTGSLSNRPGRRGTARRGHRALQAGLSEVPARISSRPLAAVPLPLAREAKARSAIIILPSTVVADRAGRYITPPADTAAFAAPGQRFDPQVSGASRGEAGRAAADAYRKAKDGGIFARHHHLWESCRRVPSCAVKPRTSLPKQRRPLWFLGGRRKDCASCGAKVRRPIPPKRAFDCFSRMGTSRKKVSTIPSL